jgi:hypothetical protein
MMAATGVGKEGGAVAKDDESKKEPAPTPRLPCPFCGSARTQPFTHAGPGARVNMRCMDCGHQFKDPNLRR